MADIYMRKVASDTFVCIDEVSKEYAAKVKMGEDRKVKITEPRNIKFHRKFFAMIDLIAHNQERIEYSTGEQARERMLYAIMYILKRGHFWGPNKEHFERDSISFAKMDEMAFDQFYNEAIDVCLKYFVTTGKDELEQELLGF